MLDVLLHGRRVGTIVNESGTDVLSFVVDDEYVAESARPVLGQQFEERRHHRVFRQAAHPGRLPTFFANLLPEGALHAMVKAQTPEQGEAETLAFVGEDLPGAVVVRPTVSDAVPDPTRGQSFDEPAAIPSGSPVAQGLRFSLAGVQLKFSAVPDGQRFTLPFRGQGGRWILKFGSPQFPELPENEFAVMRWAADCGLNVPRHALVPASAISGLDDRFAALGECVFAIERYDRRPDGARIHQEDFAQVRGVHPDLKYGGASHEGLARFIGDLCGGDDLLEFVRRTTFLLLCGNTDAHLKNWSLVYPDGRMARLSPAYDFVFVRNYPGLDRRLALPLAKEREPERIGWEHFTRIERFLSSHGLNSPIVATAREFVDGALDSWRTSRAEASPPFRDRLEEYQGGLPIVRGS